jgi:hypothetical protein
MHSSIFFKPHYQGYNIWTISLPIDLDTLFAWMAIVRDTTGNPIFTSYISTSTDDSLRLLLYKPPLYKDQAYNIYLTAKDSNFNNHYFALRGWVADTSSAIIENYRLEIDHFDLDYTMLNFYPRPGIPDEYFSLFRLISSDTTNMTVENTLWTRIGKIPLAYYDFFKDYLIPIGYSPFYIRYMAQVGNTGDSVDTAAQTVLSRTVLHPGYNLHVSPVVRILDTVDSLRVVIDTVLSIPPVPDIERCEIYASLVNQWDTMPYTVKTFVIDSLPDTLNLTRRLGHYNHGDSVALRCRLKDRLYEFVSPISPLNTCIWDTTWNY